MSSLILTLFALSILTGSLTYLQRRLKLIMLFSFGLIISWNCFVIWVAIWSSNLVQILCRLTFWHLLEVVLVNLHWNIFEAFLCQDPSIFWITTFNLIHFAAHSVVTYDWSELFWAWWVFLHHCLKFRITHDKFLFNLSYRVSIHW